MSKGKISNPTQTRQEIQEAPEEVVRTDENSIKAREKQPERVNVLNYVRNDKGDWL